MHPLFNKIRLHWPPVEGWFGRATPDTAPAAPAAPSIGLALSSGGARGLAHIGVIQVLEKAQIPIAAVIGSSMGAYVGSLWAAGVHGLALEELAAEIKDRRTLLKLLDPAIPPTRGFLRGDKIRRHLERTLGGITIGQLQRRMFIVATNLDTVSCEVLPDDMPVAAAVQASSAIPGICAPVHLDGKRYIDGGASEPLPVSLLRKKTNVDHVIAVSVMPDRADIASCQLRSFPMPPQPAESALGRAWESLMRHINLFAYGNVLDTFKRCLTSAQLRLTMDESALADVLIHPFFCESKWYDFENFNLYIEAGRRAAESALPRIQALMNPKNPTPMNRYENPASIPALGCGKT